MDRSTKVPISAPGLHEQSNDQQEIGQRHRHQVVPPGLCAVQRGRDEGQQGEQHPVIESLDGCWVVFLQEKHHQGHQATHQTRDDDDGL